MSKAYLQFLMQVLQATAKSEGDAKVIYPLLVQNTAYLNPTLAEVLRHLATTTLPEMQPDVAQSIAGVIVDFSNLIRQFPLGNKASNMEIAIAGYEGVLTLFTRDAFPQDWAMTQNNLGLAYSDRIVGDKAQKLELAIKSYSAALQVLTRDAFPQNYTETLFNLGIAYQDAQRFTEAYTTFNRAIETVELLRGEIVSGDETKRKQAEEWNQIYRSMVEVCLELDNITEAIEYAERSKTRNLVELILDRDLKTIFPSEVVTQLEQLRDEIASGQYQLQNGKAENPTALAQHVQQLRQQRNDLQNRHLPIGYGFKLDKFQAILDEHTTVVEWYITTTGFETLDETKVA